MTGMNRIITFSRYALGLIIIALLFHSCEKSPDDLTGGTTETTSANIIGTILDSTGAPVKGARVRLFPVTYNPFYTSNALKIDSVLTNGNGTFAFTLQSNGFFNYVAQNGGLFSFKDSIYGNKSTVIILPDDTLRAPGSVSGTAHVAPGDENKTIIILVLGTNYYTMADDSMGHFHIPALAQGKYTLRILTTLKGYSYLDTTVSIVSGKNTVIPGVLQLKYEGIPAIGPVTSRYDLRTMHVFLSWPACDTSDIAAIFVFRFSDTPSQPLAAFQPLAILNKCDTSFNEDVAGNLTDYASPTLAEYSPDSLRYFVAVQGKDRNLGKAGASDVITRQSIIASIDTISIANLNKAPNCEVAIDNLSNIYVGGVGPFVKLTPTGSESALYVDTFYNVNVRWKIVGNLPPDGNANIFIFDRTTPRLRLIRLTSDLDFISRTTLPDVVTWNEQIDMVATRNGMLSIISSNGTSPTHIRTVDSTMAQVKDTTLPDYITRIQSFNDTLLCLIDNAPGNQSGNAIKAYDVNFNELNTWNLPELLKEHSATSARDFYIAPGGMFCFVMDSNLNGGYEVLFFDRDRRFLGRCCLSGHGMGIDGANRIYWYDGDASIFVITLQANTGSTGVLR